MKRLVIFSILITVPLWSQTNGNSPFAFQSTHSVALSCGTNTLCFANSVRVNDVVVCVGNWDAQGTLSSIQFGDTGGILSFTMEPAVAGANNNLAGGASAMASQLGYAIASGSGSTTIIETQSPAFPRQAVVGCIEITPPNGATLAFDAHAEGPACSGTCPPSNTGNTTLNITTNQFNDVVVCALAAPSPGSNNLIWSPATGSVSPNFGWVTGNVGNPTIVSWGIAGAAGSKTCTWGVNNNNNGGAGTTALNYFTPLAIAFKPSTLTIGTSQMPDAGVGVSYSATFTLNGGTGAAPTWSIIGPSAACSGITVNAGTGVFSGSNPTTAGTCSFTARVTDGTNTANQALSLTVASTLQTIQAPICTTYATNPGGHTIAGVKAGDALFACALEVDTHGQDGQLQPASQMSDTCGDVLTQPQPIISGQQGGLVCYTGKALCSGTIGLNQTLPGGTNPTPLAGVFCDVTGAQAVIDTMQVSNAQPTGTSQNLNTSYTTPVPNQLVLGVAASDSSGTASFNAPCTTIASSLQGFANLYLCDESATTTGSYGVTAAFSNASNFNSTTPLLAEFALRPAIPPVGPSVVGEKKRRHPE